MSTGGWKPSARDNAAVQIVSVFLTIKGKQIQKPVNFLSQAWNDAGLKGAITFNQIRSSVSTQANKHLTEKDRRQVAKAMCHDQNTLEHFYVALPDKATGFGPANSASRLWSWLYPRRLKAAL
ncbi:Cyclic GMP-AMP synthase [Dissostichus eleginoides]|uniref:Cyclic GMP-AMP synthase n=1 Tax=Dissostichus eleginoides TaxID=100907 RepID=A0AAD9ET77_DISEL|nr:Cyclic GMP-AMP synthase [Dissostichus eleginoides]